MAPCVGLDWDLTDSEVAGIASMVFAGILLGSLFWGPIADIYGRRLSYLWGIYSNYAMLYVWLFNLANFHCVYFRCCPYYCWRNR